MPDNVAAPAAAPAAPAAAAPTKVETAPAKVETKAAPPPVDAAKKEQERMSAALARAKRIETENRKAAEKVKQDQLGLEQERLKLREATEKASKHDEWSRLAQEDPMAFIEAAGITKQQMLDRMIKGDTRTPEEIAQNIVNKTLKEREEKAKQEMTAREAAQAAEIQRQNQETLKMTERYIDSLIKKDTEKYEFCAQNPTAAQKVWDVMQEYYNETAANGRPEILPYEDALETVEASLEADFEAFQGTAKKLAAKKAAAEAERLAAEKKAQKAAVVASGAKDERRKGSFREFEPRTPTVAPAEVSTDDLYKRKNRQKLVEDINQTIKASKA